MSPEEQAQLEKKTEGNGAPKIKRGFLPPLPKLDPKDNVVFKSIFRHKLDQSPRNRTLAVVGNVFLHLHPPTINRDAVRYNYT